jgi:lipoprotein-releasing system ATP-binding protein
MTKTLIVRAEAIQKHYVKNHSVIQILRSIDFELFKGERVAIMGASGVGKSTLLHILGTLEPPTSGRLLFGPSQINLSLMPPDQLAQFRNQKLGFVFQFHYLLPELTALENAMMPAMIAGLSEKHARSLASTMLDAVGLRSRLTHRPSELSGGEQQRVAIARALLLKPELIFADEPTGNLDSSNRKLVMELLLGLAKQHQMSLLLVTHDPEICASMQRVLVMRDGKFISDDS